MSNKERMNQATADVDLNLGTQEERPTPTRQATKYTQLRTIERQILELEGVSVVFRASGNMLIPGAGYDFENRLKHTASLKHLLSRIKRALSGWKGAEIEFAIVGGRGVHIAKGKDGQPLKNIIASYDRQK